MRSASMQKNMHYDIYKQLTMRQQILGQKMLLSHWSKHAMQHILCNLIQEFENFFKCHLAPTEVEPCERFSSNVNKPTPTVIYVTVCY